MRAVITLRRLLGKNLLAALLGRAIAHAHAAFRVYDIVGAEMITIVQVDAGTHRRLQRAGTGIRFELDYREGYAEKYGFHDTEQHVFKSRKGLNPGLFAEISQHKGEPAWMLEYRLKALEIFEKKPLPNWGGDLTQIDFQDIFYYVKPTSEEAKTWDDVPADMKRTFDKLGIPEAEQKFLSGVGAQYDSEVVYHKIQEKLEKLGVIFLSCDHGLRDHEELFKQ